MLQVFVHYDFAMVICFEDIPGEPPLNCTGCGRRALLQRTYDYMQIIAVNGDCNCYKMPKFRHRLQDVLGPDGPVNNCLMPASASAIVCSTKTLGPSKFLTLAQYRKMMPTAHTMWLGVQLLPSWEMRPRHPQWMASKTYVCGFHRTSKPVIQAYFQMASMGCMTKTERLCHVHHHACNGQEKCHGHHGNIAGVFVSNWSSKKKGNLQGSR